MCDQTFFETEPLKEKRQAGSPQITDNKTDVLFHFGRLIIDINRMINSGAYFDRVLDFIFDSLKQIVPYDRIGVALLEGEVVRARWVKSKSPAVNLSRNYNAPLKGSSLEAIIRSGQPRILNDLRQYAREHPSSESTRLILKDGIQSSLTFALLVADKPVGFVFFSSFEKNTYNQQHIESFQNVADEISVIIEYGRLKRFFEETQVKEQTLGAVLHDLRSPLSVVQGLIETLPDEAWFTQLSDESKCIFDILLKNTGYMFSLIAELAEINQLDRQSGVVHYEQIELGNFVEEVAKNAQLLALKKHISLTVTLDNNLPKKIFFEPRKIRQVLDNLISNAIKFSHPDSIINFSVAAEPEQIVFSITDQGQGIPKEDMGKLFTDFGKTSVHPTGGESSTGLGLAIAKRIVMLHGGEISARSQVGVGSVFSFWLPVNGNSSIH